MERHAFLSQILQSLEISPVVAIIGPRQCGKTTLSKLIAKACGLTPHYFDLENPIDLARLDEPMLALQSLEGLIVIDEIQRRPDLFPVLRVLVDEKKPRKFLILGSASRDLIQQSSESLAGRILYSELTPFTLAETKECETLWLRGGFPNAYLAKSDEASFIWREGYIQTFLERDIPNLGFKIPARTMHRFWMMLSHYHGQIFNASQLGLSLGVSHVTIRHYLDIMTGTFMVRELSPWHENIKKRQIKSPKIFLRDSGIFHALIGVNSIEQLRLNPRLGASWEGMVLEEIIRYHHARTEECYFWGIHQQAELDLLIVKEGQRKGFEVKYKDAPVLTKSMQAAMQHLQLDELTVVYPGNKDYQIAENIFAKGLDRYING